MRLTPHLSFDGQCKTAFLFYQQLFGGTLSTMLSYGESPMAAGVDSRWHGRILHVTLRTDEFELAGADLLPDDYKKPQGFSVIIDAKNSAEAERMFNALASGGVVSLPFQQTFWSAGFGVLVDRFGIPWEINSAEDPVSANT